MARLRRGVHDGGGLERLNERQHAGTIPDIELVVRELPQLPGKARLVPAGVALGAKEDRALVVVDPVDRVTELTPEVQAHF